MLTRNWYNQYASQLGQTLITNGIKDSNGTIRNSGWYVSPSFNYMPSMFGTSSNVLNNGGGGGFLIGTGTTPPSIDDYKLESAISINNIGMVAGHSIENGNPVLTLTLSNNTGSDININEIGWNGYAYYTAGGSSSTACLFDRQVLPQTVTIPAGGVGRIKYTIMLPQIPE